MEEPVALFHFVDCRSHIPYLTINENNATQFPYPSLETVLLGKISCRVVLLFHFDVKKQRIEKNTKKCRIEEGAEKEKKILN